MHTNISWIIALMEPSSSHTLVVPISTEALNILLIKVEGLGVRSNVR